MEAPAAMDAADGDARGFKAVFTAAGEELLQGRMREKLREFRRSESDPEGLLLVRCLRSPARFPLCQH